MAKAPPLPLRVGGLGAYGSKLAPKNFFGWFGVWGMAGSGLYVAYTGLLWLGVGWGRGLALKARKRQGKGKRKGLPG